MSLKELNSKISLQRPYIHIILAKMGWNDKITCWSILGENHHAPHHYGLYIGSVSLGSNTVICNKNYKTVITLSSNYFTLEDIPSGNHTNENII